MKTESFSRASFPGPLTSGVESFPVADLQSAFHSEWEHWHFKPSGTSWKWLHLDPSWMPHPFPVDTTVSLNLESKRKVTTFNMLFPLFSLLLSKGNPRCRGLTSCWLPDSKVSERERKREGASTLCSVSDWWWGRFCTFLASIRVSDLGCLWTNEGSYLIMQRNVLSGKKWEW